MEKSFTTSAIRKRQWRLDFPERYLKGNRENTWRASGIDVEEANKFRDSIKNCQVCGSGEALHVDHCHATGKVRGMLCRACNHGLGNFKDDPDLLNKAIDYLSKRVYN